jgi:hypothetical protein
VQRAVHLPLRAEDLFSSLRNLPHLPPQDKQTVASLKQAQDSGRGIPLSVEFIGFRRSYDEHKNCGRLQLAWCESVAKTH